MIKSVVLTTEMLAALIETGLNKTVFMQNCRVVNIEMNCFPLKEGETTSPIGECIIDVEFDGDIARRAAQEE